MDNKKIGELIAKIRKEKGMTQQELGDKVGVGSRAVSKWECGITVPDISIINELSEVLDISSNELLKGKLENKKNTTHKIKFKNINKFLIAFITIIIIIITSLIILFNYKSNQSHTYYMNVADYQKYNVVGYVTWKTKELTININEFTFHSEELANKRIIEYQYNIKLGDKNIFSYGQTQPDTAAQLKYTISDIKDSLKNIYKSQINISKHNIEKKPLSIQLTITDEENNKSIHDIKISLYKSRK